jgi:predicted transcriptional regulator
MHYENSINREEKAQQTVIDNRQRIYDYIKNNPGSHLRRISKVLSIALGDTQYQLNRLENASKIRSRKVRLYKTYYTISISGERNEKISAILQQETPRDIILYLIENPGATHSQIANHKGFSGATINWHMSHLIQIGLVYSHKEGRYTKYYLNGSVRDIVELLKSYHPSLWNKLSLRLAEVFLDLSDNSKSEIKSIPLTDRSDGTVNDEIKRRGDV